MDGGYLKRLFDKILNLTGATKLAEAKVSGDAKKLRDLAVKEGAKPLAYIEAYALPDDAKQNLSKLIDSGKGGVIREDLLPALLSFAFRSKTQQELVQLFNGYLSDKHLRGLQVAMAASNLRKLGQDEAAKRLVNSALREHGKDALKINNLYSAGYFDSYIAWQRGMFWYEDSKAAPQRFKDWFATLLRFFSRAIFVNEDTTDGEITSGLNTRLKAPRQSQKNVAVWAAGVSKIERVAKVLDKWVGDRATFDYDVAIGHYGSATGVRFVVFDKASNPDLKPSRLPRFWESGT